MKPLLIVLLLEVLNYLSTFVMTEIFFSHDQTIFIRTIKSLTNARARDARTTLSRGTNIPWFGGH